MKWNVGTKIGVGFCILLVAFIVVGLVSYRTTNELIAASDLRKQSYEVLRAIDDLVSQLQDVEIGQRSYAITGDESYRETSLAAATNAEQALRNLRALVQADSPQAHRLDAIEPAARERIAYGRDTIAAIVGQGVAAGEKMIRSGKGKALMHQIRTGTREMEREELGRLDQRAEATEANGWLARTAIVAGTLAALAIAIIAWTLLTRAIARPLTEITSVAARVAVGDLDARLPDYRREDEVGRLARAFSELVRSLQALTQVAERIAAGDLRVEVSPRSRDDVLGNAFLRMAENLRTQIRTIVEGAAVLGSASSQIVTSTAQLASSAAESATAVNETTTTVEEVRQTAHMASEKAQLVAGTAQRAAQISQQGRKSTEDMTGGIERIRQQMGAIAASMMRLSEQSHAIGQVIATVEDLAAQSNLLAVNAAMEAAKAGDAGKGFGVVAQEVKSLAEQSRQATNQVRTILADIQKAASAAVLATEEGGKAVEAGAGQTAVARDSIRTLYDSVSEAAQAATQIAASSQQQLVGVDQVGRAMGSILEASNQNVASAKQLESAARELDDLGQRLKQAADRYEV
ncbi:MAG TPA: methyl-accepting chemotaxis protein [Usitatibacter sp.]|nr:methyl-accepting chemotaxis protein [Usitatibacter sp.]